MKQQALASSSMQAAISSTSPRPFLGQDEALRPALRPDDGILPAAAFQSYHSCKFSFPFPVRLHWILEAAPTIGVEHIMSWNVEGDGFRVHDRRAFQEHIMPQFFPKQSRYKSFSKQLNLYNFDRTSKCSKDRGSYRRRNFVRGKPHLARLIRRGTPRDGPARLEGQSYSRTESKCGVGAASWPPPASETSSHDTRPGSTDLDNSASKVSDGKDTPLMPHELLDRLWHLRKGDENSIMDLICELPPSSVLRLLQPTKEATQAEIASDIISTFQT